GVSGPDLPSAQTGPSPSVPVCRSCCGTGWLSDACPSRPGGRGRGARPTTAVLRGRRAGRNAVRRGLGGGGVALQVKEDGETATPGAARIRTSRVPQQMLCVGVSGENIWLPGGVDIGRGAPRRPPIGCGSTSIEHDHAGRRHVRDGGGLDSG
ncbi:hypothetical protein Trydic_g18611, partial [Trypoxylus dichotomus]